MFTRTGSARTDAAGSVASRAEGLQIGPRRPESIIRFSEVCMVQLSHALVSHIVQRHGIVTRAELLADGFSRREIDRASERGAITRVHNGVYRMSTSPDTFEARCVAACAADSEATITGTAAARLWGARHVRPTDQPIVLVAHDRTPLARGVVLEAYERARRRRPRPTRSTASASQARLAPGSTVLATSTMIASNV